MTDHRDRRRALGTDVLSIIARFHQDLCDDEFIEEVCDVITFFFLKKPFCMRGYSSRQPHRHACTVDLMFKDGVYLPYFTVPLLLVLRSEYAGCDVHIDTHCGWSESAVRFDWADLRLVVRVRRGALAFRVEVHPTSAALHCFDDGPG